MKKLIEMHAGTGEAHGEGEENEAEFVSRSASAAPEEHTAAEPSGGGATPGLRILVADDNVDAAESLAMFLTLTGNEVRTVADGMAAVAAAAEFRPDAAILDIGMPRLDGHGAARRIRQEPWGKGVVLVALTGWGAEEDRRRSREAGFDYHLTKPVDPAALLKLLAEVKPGSDIRARGS